ncbi:helix-turn-helix domain-containing protein [Neobacillus niacini]|uniref:helix-turn-helix domain-containing protein n=1 Tax=Neobacillus niacini TaxID=86668 RepID=UPI0021CAF877|nr:helix-turn-helix transcriptional regulator [Neobacillus niacini]MCM3763484.1 helix-turn-helix domain-containing protein [Neobacillus niacini]
MSINEKIRNYIEKNGLKFNFVADKVQIEEKRFYRLINSETKISAEDLGKICKGLDVDPSFFLN